MKRFPYDEMQTWPMPFAVGARSLEGRLLAGNHIEDGVLKSHRGVLTQVAPTTRRSGTPLRRRSVRVAPVA
jgi:hypothetical protein